MPPQPAIKTSPFRKEIEEMIIEGKSSRYISKWLDDNGVSISHTAINNYRNNGFNVKYEAAKKYREKQSQKRKEKAVNKQVDDIDKIDDIIARIDPSIVKELEPKEQIKAVPQLLKTKYQILRVIDETPQVDVKVDVNNDQIPDHLIGEVAKLAARIDTENNKPNEPGTNR